MEQGKIPEPASFINAFREHAGQMIVNDVHSKLNRTEVLRIEIPDSLSGIQDAVRANRRVCVSGSRHSMGSQQFAEKEVLLDLSRINRVISP